MPGCPHYADRRYPDEKSPKVVREVKARCPGFPPNEIRYVPIASPVTTIMLLSTSQGETSDKEPYITNSCT